MERKEAIEIVRKLYNESLFMKKDKEAMVTLIPELKESDDERIRKRFICFLTNLLEQGGLMADGWDCKECEEYITWLEKQGENNKWKPSKDEMDALYGLAYITSKMDDKKDVAITKLYQDLKREFFNGASYENMFLSSPKVEPKFHEGDWIISDTVNKDYHICKIIGIKDGNYTIESIYGYKGYNQFEEFDNVYRLWTIQDAKDGNVLVNGSNIFIFSNLSSTRVMGYCHINLDDGRFYDDKGKNECFGLIDAVFTPTTKEQYFLLFAKMKEAGYMWNAEKKELKKIEANSILSEDDETYLYEAIYAVKNFFKGCAQDELVHWLKSLYESKGKNNRSLYESKSKNNRSDYRC